MLRQSKKLDEFSSLVIELLKTEKLIESCLDFIELSEKKGIDIDKHICFISEYQRLLFESIVFKISYLLIDKIKDCKSRMKIELDKVEEKLKSDIENKEFNDNFSINHIFKISYLLIDKIKDCKSRMKIELDKVEEKLKSDIENKEFNDNFSINQKKEILDKLRGLRKCKKYRRAINEIKSVRNKRLAHRDMDSEKHDTTFENIKLICKNIQCSYDIWNCVFHGAPKLSISDPAIEYNHQNLVQALLIQQDVQLLKDIYHNQELKSGDKFFNEDIDFWSEKIMSKDMQQKIESFRENPPYTTV